MPFTLAHPAAAIPFRKLLGRAGVLSALIVGSMTPDMSYFTPLDIDRAATHSLAGLFWFCMPVGLAGYVVFHALLRPVSCYLLPLSVQDRLPQLPGSSWLPPSPIWAVLLSLMVGAATHVLWDAFTHVDGFVVRVYPSLLTFLWEMGGYRVSIYKVLQHGSTFIGFAVLGFWGWRWFSTTAAHHVSRGWRPPAALRLPVLLILLVVPAVAGIISGLSHMGDTSDMWALQQFVRHGVITAISLFGTILLCFGVIWRLWEAWSALWPRRREAL
jgi:hypothetical protein